MNMITDTQKNVLAFLAKSFNQNDIQFQITGGLAAIAHGATRPLYDIDIEIYKQDVEKVRELFREFIVEDWNNELEGPEDQFDIWMMKLSIEGVPVDINQIEETRIRSAEGDREWVLQLTVMRTESKTIDGIELPVQIKRDLIAYKKVLSRDTDIEDIRQMEALD